MNDKKVIMFRFGGIGDSICLTAVGHVMKQRGYEVIFCVPEKQIPLYYGLEYIFDEVKATRRLPAMNGIDCIKEEYGWISTEVIKRRLHKEDWLILELRHLIENNSMWGGYPANKQHGWWVRTMNSNYQNWVDLALSWANIDPTTISDEMKRPHYKLKEEEIEWAKGVVPSNQFIAINLNSSSLARAINSQYQISRELIKQGENVLLWKEDKWIFMSKDYQKVIEVNDTRQSVALLSQCKLFISADSGFSHIAEAIGKKQIIIYTTVPAWTRSKYYKHAVSLESGVPCSPCFVIGRYCPLIEMDVETNKTGLSDRQKKLLELKKNKVDAETAAKELQTTPNGLEMMFQSTMQTIEALKNAEPECVKVITAEKVMKEIEKCLSE